VKTHREILEIISGLLIMMFVANVAGTVVANALPVITAQLGSTPTQYTWLVTAALLASTATTPIWGKLADLFDKKRLLLTGIVIFTIGSLASGAAATTAQLIGFRAIQGVGMGALLILNQSILASIIPPRERGKYNAYMGAAFAAATIAGPLIGGFIVDQSWLGWRWCFWSAVPFSLGALAFLAKRLKVPDIRRPGAKVDWLGATLVTAAACDLLIWITFANHSFAWVSWQSAAMLGSTLALAALFVLVEQRVPDPVIPLRIIANRGAALAIVASIAVGTAMFGVAVFLGQYFQIARGYSPTAAGLLMVPNMLGVFVASVFGGRLLSRVGIWKPFVVTGTCLLTVGMGTLSTINSTSSLVFIAGVGVVGGMGLGLTSQNLVLAVQNSVSVRDVGSATAAVTLFRSLGGTLGIQVLGSAYNSHVRALIAERLGPLAATGDGTGTMDVSSLPPPIQTVVRSSFGDSIGLVFAIAAGVAAVALLAVLAMKSTRLRDRLDLGNPTDDGGPSDLVSTRASSSG